MDSVFTRETELTLPLEFDALVSDPCPNARVQRSVVSTKPAREGSTGVLTWGFGSAPNQHGSQHATPKVGRTTQT